MVPDPWSDWQPLPLAGPVPSEAVLAEILDGGQAFRWNRKVHPNPPGEVTRPPGRHPTVGGETSPRGSNPIWRGQWADCLAEVRRHGAALQWRSPAPLTNRVAAAIGPYFAADRDFGALADSLPWRSDAHLAACLRAFPGLRLLRQPFGETLLGFLCSATKQIVQIKQMLALLAARHGAVCSEVGRTCHVRRDRDANHGGLTESALPCNPLPTWEALAAIPERDLRDCLLGFRAKFIHDTARFLAAHPGWLEETEHLPYAAAKARLCSLPGVGEKIADCVLLFGAGRLEAFPVDVWILRTMTDRYGLHGWKPAQVAHFGRTHFGPLAGLAQQYLFAFERQAAPH